MSMRYTTLIKPKNLFAIVLLLAFSMSVQAQRWKLRRYEVGFNLGLTQAFGDIGSYPNAENWLGLKDISFDGTNAAGGFHLRYKIDPVYSVKLNMLVGFSQGADLDKESDLTNRKFSFKTTYGEISVQGEYYFISEEKSARSAAIFNRRGMLNNYRSFNAYGFLGIGGVYMSPKFEGIVRDDRDVIDGYSKFSVALPIGLGLRYVIDDRWLLGGELGYRWTASDYLDGYHNAKYSKNNDVYYFLLFNVNYRLKTSRRNIPVFLDSNFKRVRKSRRAI